MFESLIVGQGVLRKVSFSPNFIKRVNDSRALFNQLVEKNVPIYGVNTGFGDNVKIAVDLDTAIETLRGFVRCLPEAKECGIVYGCGAAEKGDIKNSRAMQEAFEMGKQI